MVSDVPPAILQELEAHTGLSVKSFSFAGGGCINLGGHLSTLSGNFFLKWNDRKKFPGMFVSEGRGLALLREAKALAVPNVIYAGEAGSFQFILLEHIAEGKKSKTFWRDFGSGLATLHATSATAFGLDHDNYIGSLPQQNTLCVSWVDFFIEQRLKRQLQISHDGKTIDRGITEKFESLFRKLPSILTEEPPSLLHGDLWSGNIMVSAQGNPSLIDPAVYFGHREMDLAMTKLFGGFDRSYLESYQEAYILQPGYEERFEVYNLYPLLVHLNLFGGEYFVQVAEVLKRFV